MSLAIGIDALPASETLLASAARTADVTSEERNLLGARGLIVVINVTADPASASVVFTIEGVNYPSGKSPGATPVTWTILQSAAVAAVGTTVLRVHPDIAAVTNVAAADLVPDIVRVVADHADTDSITYSVSLIATP